MSLSDLHPSSAAVRAFSTVLANARDLADEVIQLRLDLIANAASALRQVQPSPDSTGDGAESESPSAHAIARPQSSSLSTNPWYVPCRQTRIKQRTTPRPSTSDRQHYPGGPVGMNIATATPSQVSPEGLSAASDPIGIDRDDRLDPAHNGPECSRGRAAPLERLRRNRSSAVGSCA